MLKNTTPLLRKQSLSPGLFWLQGQPHGGTEENQKLRFAVLERLRAVAWLTPLQNEFWHIFKEKWDEWGKNALGQDWWLIFVREVECIQKRLLDGDVEAASKWMEYERVRVLDDCPILQIPESILQIPESWGK